MQRIARGALGALLVGSGGAIAWTSWIGLATVAGAGVAGVGVFVIYRANRAPNIYRNSSGRSSL